MDEKMPSGNAGMEKLILIVNKLQDVCNRANTKLDFLKNLPQIAVVGCQSAGKSSVLENFVGRDFLPRGSGIVTRRPLILRLKPNVEEYGEFDHCKDESNQFKKFVNFDDIRKEIEAETDRETGTNKGISNKPIVLRVYSPKVLELTLVDLPGTTKVAVGDQPADIENQIREMILEFIRQENCLILAVSPANADLANSDALKLAKEVDGEGLRTIGVLTKLDLMDKGTDARDIFDGKFLPLRRGYIGVVNRSQNDINNNKDIAATLQAEREFFNSHVRYQAIANRLGTPHLQKVLNHQLKEHILNTIDNVQETVVKKKRSCEEDIRNYERLYTTEDSIIRELMFEIIYRIQSDFNKEMGSLGSDDVNTHKISCGAKIRRIFHESFRDELAKIQADENELREEIVYTIENLYGINGILNTPFKAVELPVKKLILRLEDPINTCIESVVKELKNAVRTCTRAISNHPKFVSYVEKDIIMFIDASTESNKRNILSLVQMEAAYMNLMHEGLKIDKLNGLVTKVEQIADLYSELLTFDQRKALVGDLKQHISTYVNSQTNEAKLDDRIIRQGVLDVDFRIDLKRYLTKSHPCWFVLRPQTLNCCDANNHNSVFWSITLDGLKFQMEKSDTESSKHHIALVKPGGNILHNCEQMNLSSASIRDIRLWAKSFASYIESDETNRLDGIEKDVDDTYEKIRSYFRIVKRTMGDMVPKAITSFIIQKLQQFIRMKLLMKVSEIPVDVRLKMFSANDQEIEKYKTDKQMQEICSEVLEIIGECNAAVVETA